MKKLLLLIAIALCGCLNAFSQATSLTVDCQTPGWLSSLINYEDQQTLENIKVTGYINGTDIQFIYDLNNRSLTGVIDLEDVSIVKGGTLYTNNTQRTVEEDNTMPKHLFYDKKNPIRKFIYPKTLVACPRSPSFYADSIIWTNTSIKSISDIGYAKYLFIPEGIEEIYISNLWDCKITFPKTLKKCKSGNNLIIYSFIEEPETVYAQIEDYRNLGGYDPIYSYWSAVTNSTFFIPKGTLDKYLRSDFSTMDSYRMENGNYIRI